MSQRKIAEAVVAKMKASAQVAMDHSDDGGDASSTHSVSEASSEASSSSRPTFTLRDQSPLKDAILTKFAKLSTPNSLSDQPVSLPVSINSGDHEEHPHLPQSSWLHSVKGRIAKTVEEKKREYSELKAERELRRQILLQQQATAAAETEPVVKRETVSLHGSMDGGGGVSEFVRAYEDESACLEGSQRDLSLSSDASTITMSHSVSESKINESGIIGSGSGGGDDNGPEVCSSLPDFRTSQSLDEFMSKEKGDSAEGEEEDEEALKTPLLFETEEPDGKGARSKATPKERRRFSAFFSSRSANVTPKKDEFVDKFPTSEPNPSVSANSLTATPTRASLRERVMGFMGKTPSGASGRGSLTLRELGGSGEEPFSLTSLDPSPVTEEHSVVGEGKTGEDDEDSVEEAVEADELLVYDPANDEAGDPLQSDEADVGGSDGATAAAEDASLLSHYWWVASLPICAIILVQLLPLPSWVLGFLSGIVLSAFVIAFWKFFKFVRDPDFGTRFVENVRKKLPSKPAIIVQEELERQYTWMNIWPHKNGPYDPLTYDVRRTMSVRVMIHGPWVELKFPKRNLPLRQMYNDVEPTSVAFIDHKEVIDLTNCHIDLIPENLPNKRTWSKKYPIRIRTNMRLPCKDQVTNRETHPDDPSQAPDPVARVKSEPDSEGRDESPVTENCEDVPDQTNSEDFEREEGEPLAEIFKDPLTAMAEQEEARKLKMEEEGLSDDDEFDEVSAIDKGKEVSNGEYVSVPGDDEPDEDNVKTFYLFTRTSREKEEWFNRLMVGAKFMQDWNHQNPPPERQVKPDPNYETYKVKGQKFKLFMEDYFQARHDEGAQKVHEMTRSDENRQQIAREQMAFVNIFGARLWHDLHDSTAFIDLLREKLTRKLLKVKIAQYFEEVRVTTLDLGQRLPQVQSVSLPWQDEAGLWMNLEVEYGGVAEATVDTQGIRLPSKDEPLDREAAEFVKRATMDSDEEDSAEEDSAEERENAESDLLGAVNNRNSSFDAASGGNGGSGGSSGSTGGGKGEPHVHGAGFKVRMIEGLLKSDFVARLAEKDWVKRNITEQCITLQLQLHSVKGTLTLNVPPSPSDRLWYGFRTPPEMQLALRPSFGGRSLGKYESWIISVMRRLEERLKEEFVKVLVYPNLDDIVLPGMVHVPYHINEAADAREEDNEKA